MEDRSANLLSSSSMEFDPEHTYGFIGQGASGSVVNVKFLGCEYAIKIYEGNKDRFKKEMNALGQLGHHPNTVRLLFYTMTEKRCYLIMEKMQMNLSEYIRDRGQSLSVVAAVALMLEIGEGLKHIHRKGMAHRDLKPDNVLINLQDDPSNNTLTRIRSVKIADFGEAKAADRTRPNQTTGTGTTLYMALEVIKEKTGGPEKVTYNPLIYSFGIVCSVILTGLTENLYGTLYPSQVKQRVINGSLRPQSCPQRLATLIANRWGGDYLKRPLFPEICWELRDIKSLLLTAERIVQTPLHFQNHQYDALLAA